MRVRIFALTILLGCASVAHAESGAKVAEAQVAPMSPEAEKASSRLLVASGTEKQFDQMLPRIIDVLLPTFVPGNEARQAELRQIFTEEFLDKIKVTTPAIMNKARQVYADHFSVAELNQLSDFYETPLGAKMVRETPQIMMEMMAFGRQAGQAAAQAALPRIIERLRAAHFVLPKGA
jgi:hypothetical protein